MKPIDVMLVDDHRMVLEGLRVLLEPLEFVAVTGTCTTAAEVLTALQAHVPDVLLLDINLPDQNGVDLCLQLTQAYPTLRVLALTTLNEKSYVTRMMQNGAAGYVLKNASPEELAEAITRVHAGKKYFSDEVQELLLQPTPAAPEIPVLTRREKEVLALIADGLTSHDIAEKLFLSALTVETHRRNIITKFGVSNTASLIKLAAQYQLI
ncbi:response regulator [Hymenobacter wooponensis]|uniref:Response regulator transcription factor n=1 Tax=Hymenobacter wooponensis TaxID=1525360 RepID=A0A4Z0MBM2_9BACT|nr:response regulator transcription factor [Hymenobacter wooponensis]TGD77153.1 response regulator transcription factor [Hymenobacter wooponensis]